MIRLTSLCTAALLPASGPGQNAIGANQPVGCRANPIVVERLQITTQDNIYFAQSPSGGGNGNPAWDFQWLIRNPKINTAYGFIMRAAYLPFENREQVASSIQPHLRALNPAEAEKSPSEP